MHINSGNKEIPPVEPRGSEQTPLLSRLLLRGGVPAQGRLDPLLVSDLVNGLCLKTDEV